MKSEGLNMNLENIEFILDEFTILDISDKQITFTFNLN